MMAKIAARASADNVGHAAMTRASFSSILGFSAPEFAPLELLSPRFSAIFEDNSEPSARIGPRASYAESSFTGVRNGNSKSFVDSGIDHLRLAGPCRAHRGAAPPPDPDALIGKAPPPIKVAKWVKGAPLTGFEKGKVYVVDFWATWCGPCREAIPHLTKLSQEHKGQLEIVGVSISEQQKDTSDTSYIEKVQHFVDKMGDRMDYRVAVDTPDKVMHDTWFKPTGTDGIPTAYIIDQNGLVAWTGIGSPSDVERIVGQVTSRNV